MGVTTKTKLNQALNDRLKALAAKEQTVKVGVFGSAASKDHGGKSNVFLAQVHEFGAPSVGIPERSFLRSVSKGADGKQIKAEQAKLLNAYLQGKVPLSKALAILGESIVSKVKRKIRSGIEPGLARPRKRGGSTPLIDTGQLINSIGYEVQK